MIRWAMMGSAMAALLWFAYPNSLGIKSPDKSTSVSAVCHDMSLSYSVNRSGTCSRRGGVREWVE